MDLTAKLRLLYNASQALLSAKAHFEMAYREFGRGDIEEGWKQEDSGNIEIKRAIDILGQVMAQWNSK